MPDCQSPNSHSTSVNSNADLRSADKSVSASQHVPVRYEANIFSVVQLLWRDRRLIALIIIPCMLLASLYAVLAPDWYTAKIVLSPTSDQFTPSIPGDLGGLASLVGLGTASSNSVEAKAVLTSRSLTGQFISDRNLLPVLFQSQWDTDKDDWIPVDPADQPDIRDAVDYFEESIRHIREDSASGLLTMYVSWKDPALAADWANELASRVNNEMRRRALEEATSNVEFLQKEIANTNQVAMQQSIGAVLESELQRLLIARGNDQFAFKIIDPAEVPKYKSKPKRILIIAATLLFSMLVAFVIVLSLEIYRKQKRMTTEYVEKSEALTE